MVDLPENQLVLVAYYVQSVDEIGELVEDFQRASRMNIARTIVVDNGGALPSGKTAGDIEIIAGDNGFWEFSGWLAGLDHLQADLKGLTILLNDSYARNWTIEAPGRRVLGSMARIAARGRIAGWLDNFSRTSRTVNSRIVILSTELAPLIRHSIEAAIRGHHARRSANLPLFDTATASRLERWLASQDGRWSEAASETRLSRIFVEHRLFDGVPPDLLALRPRTWLGSQLYGLARKLAGERR